MSAPPKLFVIGDDATVHDWRMVHLLPRPAVNQLRRPVCLPELEPARVVDLTRGLDDPEHRRVLLEVDRHDRAGLVLWPTDDEVHELAKAWQTYWS